jgi:hypothetical protein
MKKIVILFVSILAFSISFANASNKEKDSAESNLMTTSISGKVLDKITGEALAGVKVSINGTEKSTYTDFEGNFELNGLRSGIVELNATYISYKEKVENINVNLDTFNQVEVKIESL